MTINKSVSFMHMKVVLLKSFRATIKGPTLIASWKSGSGREFGKFQHFKGMQQYKQNLSDELFNICFYNIFEIHNRFLFLYGNLVHCDLTFSVYYTSVCNRPGNIKTSIKPVIYHVRSLIPLKNNYFSDKKAIEMANLIN